MATARGLHEKPSPAGEVSRNESGAVRDGVYSSDGERMFAGMAYALEKKARRSSGTAVPGAGRSSSSTGTFARQCAREKVRTCGACLPDQ